MDGYGTIKKKADDTATANCVPCNEFAFPTCTVLCSHLRKTERKEINVLLYCEELNNRVLFKAISDKLDISRKMQHHLSLKEFKKQTCNNKELLKQLQFICYYRILRESYSHSTVYMILK